MNLYSTHATCDGCAERYLGPALHARHEQRPPGTWCAGCGQTDVFTYRYTYWYPWPEGHDTITDGAGPIP